MNDFTTTFTVDASPQQVFDAIIDVRAWWIGDIEGETANVGDVFTYRHDPQHRSVQRVTESIPGVRVVWQVEDAELTFVDDRTEWIGTEIRFDITGRDGKTELRFSHLGLTPDIECFDACSNAWGSYVNGSLRKLITERASAPATRDYTTTVTIDRPPAEVFAAVLETRAWWNERIEGSTTQVGDEFWFEVPDLHRTRMRVNEITPDSRIEWVVLENEFTFVADQTEWVGDRIVFELADVGGATQLTFTQHGLVPELECYDVCSNAWAFFVRDSLRALAEAGAGQPEANGDAVPAARARVAVAEHAAAIVLTRPAAARAATRTVDGFGFTSSTTVSVSLLVVVGGRASSPGRRGSDPPGFPQVSAYRL